MKEYKLKELPKNFRKYMEGRYGTGSVAKTISYWIWHFNFRTRYFHLSKKHEEKIRKELLPYLLGNE